MSNDNKFIDYGIIFAGYAGTAGAGAIASARREELLLRYPKDYIQAVIDEANSERTEEQTQIIRSMPYYTDAGRGGIFEALWSMAGALDSGFIINLNRIPVRSSTVELCEYFDINPYMLYSCGTAIFITEHETAVIDRLREAGCSAVSIGYLTDGNGKFIRNGEGIRCLDPARGHDEIDKITGCR